MTEVAQSSPDLIEDFVDEAVDSLRDLSAQLSVFRQQPDDKEPIHAVFRAVHSIKGCAGFLGLSTIQRFAHTMENTLDDVREGQVPLLEEIERVLVTGFDMLEGMLNAVGDGDSGSEMSPEGQEVLDNIVRLASEHHTAIDPFQQFNDAVMEIADQLAKAGLEEWAQQLTALSRPPEAGEEDAREDEIAYDGAAASTVKPVGSFIGGEYRCGETDVSGRVESLLQVFLAVESGEYDDAMGTDFLQNLSDFAASANDHGDADLAASLHTVEFDFRTIHDSPLQLDTNLVAIVWGPLASVLEKIAVDQPAAAAAAPAAADAVSKSQSPSQGASKSPTIRLRAERLDEFSEQVSELFITCELLRDLHARLSDTATTASLNNELRQIVNDFKAQTTSLQKSVADVRRVPVSQLFSRFPRMGRSLAAKLDKKIDVHISGEEIEADKAMLDDLEAPLTHLVRNVVDHGIEIPENRLARGRDETGNMWLSAEETRSHLVIQIRDDGQGIDPERMRSKAVEKGVISEQQARLLRENECVELIFHPGFSTAERVSDVSGRGVGMDVVRTAVEQHSGRVTVASKIGEGTTFRLELPIRSAVLVVDGLLVHESGQEFVIPFEHVRELTEIDLADLAYVHGLPVARIRGEAYDAVRLGTQLGLPVQRHEDERHVPAVLSTCGQRSACFLVERVLGQRQVVVSRLSRVLPDCHNIDGVAQLGGGRLALVLSVAEMLKARQSGR